MRRFVPQREVYHAFSVFDSMLYEMGYVLKRPEFVDGFTALPLKPSSKRRFIVNQKPQGSVCNAPEEFLLYVQENSSTLEAILLRTLPTLPAGSSLLDVVKTTSEELKEQAVQGIKKSRLMAYLDGPFVHTSKLAELVSLYRKTTPVRGTFSIVLFCRYVSEVLKTDYGITLTEDTIKDAINPLSNFKRLPRQVYYVMLDLIRSKDEAMHRKVFTTLVSITELFGKERRKAWIKDKVETYGFRTKSQMFSAVATCAGLEYEAVYHNIMRGEYVDYRIVSCFQEWQVQYLSSRTITVDPSYRCVSTLVVAELIRSMRRYFPRYNELFSAAENYVPVGSKALQAYMLARPSIKSVRRDVYDGLLRMKSDLEIGRHL